LRQAYDYWQDQPGNYHQRNPLRETTAHQRAPQKRMLPDLSCFHIESLSSSCYPWTMFLVPQTNLGLGKCAPNTPRNISTRECVAVCVCATSPLLYGPFLISPRRDQSATPRISTPKPPRPDIKSRDTDRSALAPELPQAPLRGEVPTRVAAHNQV